MILFLLFPNNILTDFCFTLDMQELRLRQALLRDHWFRLNAFLANDKIDNILNWAMGLDHFLVVRTALRGSLYRTKHFWHLCEELIGSPCGFVGENADFQQLPAEKLSIAEILLTSPPWKGLLISNRNIVFISMSIFPWHNLLFQYII